MGSVKDIQKPRARPSRSHFPQASAGSSASTTRFLRLHCLVEACLPVPSIIVPIVSRSRLTERRASRVKRRLAASSELLAYCLNVSRQSGSNPARASPARDIYETGSSVLVDRFHRPAIPCHFAARSLFASAFTYTPPTTLRAWNPICLPNCGLSSLMI